LPAEIGTRGGSYTYPRSAKTPALAANGLRQWLGTIGFGPRRVELESPPPGITACWGCESGWRRGGRPEKIRPVVLPSLAPMLARPGRVTGLSSGWAAEVKWDGSPELSVCELVAAW